MKTFLFIALYKLRNLPATWRAFWHGSAVAVNQRRLKVLRWWQGGQQGDIVLRGELRAKIIRANGQVVNLGVICRRVVTTAFVNKVRDALAAGAADITTYKYHAIGTTNTAEAISDTALGTEVETRGVGTQVNGVSKVYTSVGSVTATAPRAIVEHGLFSASTVGTLMDRSVFSVINLGPGDALQVSYSLTLADGG